MARETPFPVPQLRPATAAQLKRHRIAAGIPGARFVALEGHNHLILELDPDWNRALEEIKSFLRGLMSALGGTRPDVRVKGRGPAPHPMRGITR